MERYFVQRSQDGEGHDRQSQGRQLRQVELDGIVIDHDDVLVALQAQVRIQHGHVAGGRLTRHVVHELHRVCRHGLSIGKLEPIRDGQRDDGVLLVHRH